MNGQKQGGNDDSWITRKRRQPYSLSCLLPSLRLPVGWDYTLNHKPDPDTFSILAAPNGLTGASHHLGTEIRICDVDVLNHDHG
jgi:hypothetical protein